MRSVERISIRSRRPANGMNSILLNSFADVDFGGLDFLEEDLGFGPERRDGGVELVGVADGLVEKDTFQDRLGIAIEAHGRGGRREIFSGIDHLFESGLEAVGL